MVLDLLGFDLVIVTLLCVFVVSLGLDYEAVLGEWLLPILYILNGCTCLSPFSYIMLLLP